jgi:hypothetical protein
MADVTMRLRDHPLMCYIGAANWPPVWMELRSGRSIRGELGVLRSVHALSLASNKCFLVMEYQDKVYLGTLIFDDRVFCAQIYNLVKQHIGLSIKEIGDLDVSHTL